MTTKRRLADLYVVGKEVLFDDGTGDPVTVYIRKMNPVEQETALRRANAARARVLAAARRSDTEEANDALAQAMDIGGKDDLISFLNASKLVSIRAAKEAELAAEEEWSKDGYLQGLFDAWNDGLDKTYALTPEEPEAKRVFEEMKRFTDAVDELVLYEEKTLRDVYSAYSITELSEKVAEEIAQLNSDAVWVREFRRCEIWLCTRDNTDRKEKYFESREEVDELPVEVYNRLVDEIRNLTVEPVEGKDLPPADSSLPSSAPQEPEAIMPSSGPVSVPQ